MLKRKTIAAKVQVLHNQWNKLLSKLSDVAGTIGDTKITEMITNINNVPKAIKMEALLKFVEQCQEYHAIAFFQWRYSFPSKYSNNDDTLKEITLEKMKRLWVDFGA